MKSRHLVLVNLIDFILIIGHSTHLKGIYTVTSINTAGKVTDIVYYT